MVIRAWTVKDTHTGIVQCEDRPYIKDSIDFLGVARTGQRNELHLVGVEVKSRLLCATAQKEKKNVSERPFTLKTILLHLLH